MVRSFAQWTKTLSFPARLSPQKQSTPSILPDKQATPISVTPDVMMMAYNGSIYPHLTYGLVPWGGCGSNLFLIACKLKKKRAIRIVAKLQFRVVQASFQNIATVSSAMPLQFKTNFVLYVSMCLDQQTRCSLVREKVRENYRTGKHRTVVHERLPTQAGVHLINSW
ncbi:hypothetical protein J6590_033241 [Homalodisca vitripennis]|nr:hypothetical protein J6590_033241 [Homalodisca vitripennis]